MLELGRAGRTATEISRLLVLPRETVRDWLAGQVPVAVSLGAAGCDRCGGAAHEYRELPKEYVYLLGLYLGDGCISSTRAMCTDCV